MITSPPVSGRQRHGPMVDCTYLPSVMRSLFVAHWRYVVSNYSRFLPARERYALTKLKVASPARTRHVRCVSRKSMVGDCAGMYKSGGNSPEEQRCVRGPLLLHTPDCLAYLTVERRMTTKPSVISIRRILFARRIGALRGLSL